MHTNTTGGPHDRKPEPDAMDELLREAVRITEMYEETGVRLTNDVVQKKPYADAAVATRYVAYAAAMRTLTDSLEVRAREIRVARG